MSTLLRLNVVNAQHLVNMLVVKAAYRVRLPRHFFLSLVQVLYRYTLLSSIASILEITLSIACVLKLVLSITFTFGVACNNSYALTVASRITCTFSRALGIALSIMIIA